MPPRRQGSILTGIEEDRRRRRRRNWWRMREMIFGRNVTCVEIQSHLNYIESLEERSANSGGSAISELQEYDRYLDGLVEHVVDESTFPSDDEMVSDELAVLVLKLMKLLKKREREFKMKKDKTLIAFVKYGKRINGVEGGKEIFSEEDVRIMELLKKNQVSKVKRLKEVKAKVLELEEEIEEKKICNNKLRVAIMATLTAMIMFTFDKADVKLPMEARVVSFLLFLVALVAWLARYKQGNEFGSELQEMKVRKMIYLFFQNKLRERLLNLYFLSQEMREEFLEGFADWDDLLLQLS